MALKDKLNYTQADGALTTSFQKVTFSDSHGELTPNAIIIRNTASSGGGTIIFTINSNLQNGTIGPGKVMRYSIKKIKQLKLKRSGSAPNYEIMAVR